MKFLSCLRQSYLRVIITCFFLEQYHLLNENFYLNTQRIVQFKFNSNSHIYLYDLEGKTLYYSCPSFFKLREDLGIHFSTYKKCIEQDHPYLGFFKITNTLLEGATSSNLNLLELNSLIAEKHASKNAG